MTDGARMPCAKYTNPNIQNAFFEGFTPGTEVTNLLVWNFKGEIIHAGINYPGSWHDSKDAAFSKLYVRLMNPDKLPPGCAILVDSAFPRTGK